MTISYHGQHDVAGKVTEESKILKCLKEMVLREQPGTTDPRPGTSSSPASSTNSRTWTSSLGRPLRHRFQQTARRQEAASEGMKVIAISGKIFTLTWMLMGFNNFA